jgi:PAS domain S-box-containing protein
MPTDTLFKSQKDLPQNDPRYRLLFENSMDGILLTSPDGQILDASPSACRILGRTREQIIEAGREGLIDAADPNLPLLIQERKRNGRAHGELTARRADGSFFPIEFSSVVFFDGEGNERTCIILRDISHRKSAEAERERLIAELQDALRKVRVLSGLLSICAACKRIRNEQGQWETLETYIRTRSEADFTHGICEDCLRKLYPESKLL